MLHERKFVPLLFDILAKRYAAPIRKRIGRTGAGLGVNSVTFSLVEDYHRCDPRITLGLKLSVDCNDSLW